ncbi:MAG TPA: S41 family peptidase [Bacteroidia bacterium]|jgi:carboxyl-terminal processing protease|nr:S41 family peptidase [Bacteroidia bacterium]
MKKIILFVLLLLFKLASAQNPNYQQKLYYTCKVWGFVKYFHSKVSTCKVNWDSVLVSRLPHIKNAVTSTNFNDELDTLLNAAGPMTIVPGVLPDTIHPELKRNRNFSWINDPVFRSDVKIILDTIKNNFRPHASCWVQNNNYTNSYNGWLVFPYDSLMINSNTNSIYPNEATRLMLIFKYWNIINYFNPYNYILDQPWDSTLYNKVLPIANAANDQIFYLAFKNIVKEVDDAHAEGLTFSQYISPPTYYYSPPIILTYAQNKYIVAQTTLSPIKKGDEIISINGASTLGRENYMRQYVSAGNNSVFHRFMCNYMLNGYYNTAANIVYKDSMGNTQILNTTRTDYIYNSWFYTYYPNDTLATVHWKKFGCGTGYVNMGLLTTSEVNTMYSNLRNCPAIIFDIRNYPNGTAWAIANKMYLNNKAFAKFTIPDVSYPGTFFWNYDYLGINGNPTPYTGKVIILMNEETQSQAEFSCMILGAMQNSVKVGSQTAGADGNITYFRLSQDIGSGFTTLGTFYANGDSTQRIGIVPDSLVSPTQLGIRTHRDEVLEKALEIASCLNSVQPFNNNASNIFVYPNPGNGNISISSAENIKELRVYDILGNIISTTYPDKKDVKITIENEGVYFIHLNSSQGVSIKKVIVTK